MLQDVTYHHQGEFSVLLHSLWLQALKHQIEVVWKTLLDEKVCMVLHQWPGHVAHGLPHGLLIFLIVIFVLITILVVRWVTWTSLGGFSSALEGFRCDGQGAAANMSKLLSMQDVWAGFPQTGGDTLCAGLQLGQVHLLSLKFGTDPLQEFHDQFPDHLLLPTSSGAAAKLPPGFECEVPDAILHTEVEDWKQSLSCLRHKRRISSRQLLHKRVHTFQCSF
mmetsp:Transcript_9895/g.16503  ORF Transcript_9895/g.16503 Transcript_9895/m.16503 type:complete len:221 (-) Transcript_9895:45-707(-)